jgi:hypothetical protein
MLMTLPVVSFMTCVGGQSNTVFWWKWVIINLDWNQSKMHWTDFPLLNIFSTAVISHFVISLYSHRYANNPCASGGTYSEFHSAVTILHKFCRWKIRCRVWWTTEEKTKRRPYCRIGELERKD